MVAGAAKVDLLADFYRAATAAHDQHETLADFQSRFDDIVAHYGWEYNGSRNWRSLTIYTTNLAASYAQGRYTQLQALAQDGLLWMYRHSDISATPREAHVRLSGLVVSPTSPWWRTHYPPWVGGKMNYGCRCYVVAVHPADVDKRGGRYATAKELQAVGDGPGYLPGDGKNVDIHAILEQKLKTLPPEIAQAFRGDMEKRLASVTEARAKKAATPDVAITAPVVADNGGMKYPSFIGQRPGLFDLPPVAVTELTGEEFGRDLGKKALALKADAYLRALQAGGGLENTDTGWVLRINRAGRKKMGDNADMTLRESHAVAGLETLAKNAIAAERHLDEEHRNPDVIGVVRLYAPLRISGVFYRAKLTAKEYRDGGKVLHALAAVEIENAPLGTFPSYSGTGVLQTGQPTTGRTMSIADLFQGANQNDGEPFVAPAPVLGRG